MTIGVGFVVGSLTVLACDHVAPSFHKARDLRRGIQDVSSLRYTLAHENAHLRLESQGPNFTGMTSVMGAFQWLASVAWFGKLPQTPSIDAVPGSTQLVQDQNAGHYFAGLPGLRLLLAYREAALPWDARSAFLRLLDSIRSEEHTSE